MNKRKNSTSSKIEDCLADAAAKAGLSDSALHGVRTWLAGQLEANQYARLSEGGHAQNPIPLRQVFVDLPVRGEHEDCFLALWMKVEALSLGNFTTKLTTAVKNARLARRRALVLSDEDESPSSSSDSAVTPANPWQAVLLIGGPGQGKSTLGQLACQFHRASLLRPIRAQLSLPQQEALHPFTQQVSAQDLALPNLPALPLQIILPDLATWLSKEANRDEDEKEGGGLGDGETGTILRYLSELPSAKAAGLLPRHLLTLATQMPLLLVFDGFDEVGAGQDRQRLVDAIAQLLATLKACEARVQLLATSRPQGYAEELAQIGVPLRKITLSPLNMNQAIAYANKLIAIQFPGANEQRNAQVRLQEAAHESATQHLLSTPLQVTILTALLEQIGRVPKERWKLFSKYYDYTFNREVARKSYASRLLADHRGHIEQIHMRVALLLQVDAERDGGSARMTRKQLDQVIETVLSEDEIAPEERAELVRDLAIAAEQRLVFLVEPEPGQFGFEIRSLQEFWAAWALSTGPDDEVKKRLLQIANAPMFRNVLLFLASKFFCDAPHLRDFFIEQVCAGLDNEVADLVAATLRSGAILALEVLEEGSALSQPKRARALMERACGVLDLAEVSLHPRLLHLANNDTQAILQAAIAKRLAASDSDYVAWFFIVLASNQGHEWARKLGDRHWQQLADFPKLLEYCTAKGLKLDSWLAAKIMHAADHVLPEHFWTMGRAVDLAIDNWAVWLTMAIHSFRKIQKEIGGARLLLDEAAVLTLPNTNCCGPLPKGWEFYLRVIEFNSMPSAQTLANCLFTETQSNESEETRFLPDFMFTWPLQTIWGFFGDDNDNERIFAEKLLTGELGDIAEWRAAEKIDKHQQYNSFSDMVTYAPWSAQSLRFGIPFWGQEWRPIANAIMADNIAEVTSFLQAVPTILQQTSSGYIRATLVLIYCHILANLTEEETLFNVTLPEVLAYYPEAIDLLIPKPACLQQKTWLQMLNTAPQINVLHQYNYDEDIFTIFMSCPMHPQIVNVVLIRMSDGTILTEFSDQEVQELCQILTDFAAQQPLLQRTEFAILHTWLGILRPERDLELPNAVVNGLDLAFSEKARPFHLTAFINALGENRLPTQRTIALLLQTYALVSGDQHQAKGKIIAQLRRLSQGNKSALATPTIWRDLDLPKPAPQQAPVPAMENDAALLDKSIALQSLELSDIRGFTSLKLEFTLPAETQGQWIVFLGQNGVGKTTLLRSLTLALRNVADRPIWPDAFSGWPRTIGENGALAKKAWIKTTLADGSTHQTIITSNGATEFKQDPKQHRPSQCLLFAYGCRRGSATGGPQREFKFEKDNGPEIATLFEEFASMVHAETWLKDLRERPDLLIAVRDAIKTFLDVEKVEFESNTLFITEHNKPRLALSQLSDGFLTSAGWFIDLLARWIAYATSQGKKVEPGFMEQMRGLVLIDEIDMHLHPRWQIEIIRRTRRLMPHMSFIVTTHNPLTLVGAKAEEIWVLENQEGKITATRGTEAPLLLTGSEIYTSYFGIDDIYPDGLGSAMQRYHFLSRYTMRNDAEEVELQQLRQRLDEAGILPEWEIVARETVAASKPRRRAKVEK